MIILIAESKTMETYEKRVSREEYETHRPSGEEYASEIMTNINEMSVADLTVAVKLSPAMTRRLKQMAYEFPNKHSGLRAMEAYTGVVFKNLAYSTLTLEEKERADDCVRIISSLYGWLKPEDIIKPYRLEYNAPLSPDDTPLFQFWRSKVTVELVRSLQESAENEILNLLPADAAKCIDWKLVKRFAKVRKVDFLEQSGESVRSPHAGRLKALRGELLREIITNSFTTTRQLHFFSNSRFLPVENYKYSDRIAYMV
ncbi:MAG: YaaA family protein [Muribaculaceae bacterium]|nr:YaaA family protein [Muribaculaceae bacterium]